jgi:hypothetical protein
MEEISKEKSEEDCKIFYRKVAKYNVNLSIKMNVIAGYYVTFINNILKLKYPPGVNKIYSFYTKSSDTYYESWTKIKLNALLKKIFNINDISNIKEINDISKIKEIVDKTTECLRLNINKTRINIVLTDQAITVYNNVIESYNKKQKSSNGEKQIQEQIMQKKKEIDLYFDKYIKKFIDDNKKIIDGYNKCKAYIDTIRLTKRS